AAAPARTAVPARVRGIDGNVCALAQASDAGARRDDDARGLVAGREGLADGELADPAVQVVVDVGSADAGRAEPQKHFARPGSRHRFVGDAKIAGPVDGATKHSESSPRKVRTRRAERNRDPVAGGR